MCHRNIKYKNGNFITYFKKIRYNLLKGGGTLKKSYLWGIITLFLLIFVGIFLLMKDEKISANDLFEDTNWNAQELSLKIDKYGENGFDSIEVSTNEKEELINALKTSEFKKIIQTVNAVNAYSITIKTNKYISFFVDSEKGIIQMLNNEDNNAYEFNENSEFIKLLLKLK